MPQVKKQHDGMCTFKKPLQLWRAEGVGRRERVASLPELDNYSNTGRGFGTPI